MPLNPHIAGRGARQLLCTQRQDVLSICTWHVWEENVFTNKGRFSAAACRGPTFFLSCDFSPAFICARPHSCSAQSHLASCCFFLDFGPDASVQAMQQARILAQTLRKAAVRKNSWYRRPARHRPTNSPLVPCPCRARIPFVSRPCSDGVPPMYPPVSRPCPTRVPTEFRPCPAHVYVSQLHPQQMFG